MNGAKEGVLTHREREDRSPQEEDPTLSRQELWRVLVLAVSQGV